MDELIRVDTGCGSTVAIAPSYGLNAICIEIDDPLYGDTYHGFGACITAHVSRDDVSEIVKVLQTWLLKDVDNG